MSESEGTDGGGRLARQVLAATVAGDRGAVATMLSMLDAEQLRSLVGVLAEEAAVFVPSERGAHGPEAVCTRAVEAAAPMFGTTPETIRSSNRSGPVADARAVAMAAARSTGLTLRAIGEVLDRDHGTVHAAVQRVAARPRLADAAAQISGELIARYEAQPLREPDPPAQQHGQDPGHMATTAATSLAADTSIMRGALEQAVAGAAAAFGISPADVLGEDRHRGASDARAVAMTAARLHGYSLPAIAQHFDRDHSTVLGATRRIEKLPPLHGTARQIAAEISDPDPSNRAMANRAAGHPRAQTTVSASAAAAPEAGAAASRHVRTGVAHEQKEPPRVAPMAGLGPAR